MQTHSIITFRSNSSTCWNRRSQSKLAFQAPNVLVFGIGVFSRLPHHTDGLEEAFVVSQSLRWNCTCCSRFGSPRRRRGGGGHSLRCKSHSCFALLPLFRRPSELASLFPTDCAPASRSSSPRCCSLSLWHCSNRCASRVTSVFHKRSRPTTTQPRPSSMILRKTPPTRLGGWSVAQHAQALHHTHPE
jgi:hypothetical protein